MRDATVVVTTTPSTDPVFDGDLLDPGTHVTAMGQYDAEKRELDATTVERATYEGLVRNARANLDALLHRSSGHGGEEARTSG